MQRVSLPRHHLLPPQQLHLQASVGRVIDLETKQTRSFFTLYHNGHDVSVLFYPMKLNIQLIYRPHRLREFQDIPHIIITFRQRVNAGKTKVGS